MCGILTWWLITTIEHVRKQVIFVRIQSERLLLQCSELVLTITCTQNLYTCKCTCLRVWTCTTMKAREVTYLWRCCSYKTPYPLSSRNWAYVCLVFRNDAEPDQISVPTSSVPCPAQYNAIEGWSYTRSIWWQT